MRTTVELDDDTAQAVDDLRRDRGLPLSAAVNELIRRGLLHKPTAARFEQRTAEIGIRIDVSNIADALEALEGAEHRG